MKNLFKKSQAKTQQLTRQEFEDRLKAAIDLDLKKPIESIVAEVKGLTSPGPASAQPRPAGDQPGAEAPQKTSAPESQVASVAESGTMENGVDWLSKNRRNLLAGLVIVVLLAVFAFVAFRFLPGIFNPDSTDATTAPTAASSTNAPVVIRFDAGSQSTVEPGGTVTLQLAAYDNNGQVVPDASLEIAPAPTDAGEVISQNRISSGATAFTYQAGNTPQSVTITARVADNPDISESYNLTIAAQPGLTVSFKDPAPAAPVKIGELLQIVFVVSNRGDSTADNVKLTVDTPPGLVISDPVQTDCAQNGNSLVCHLFGINPDSNVSAIINYRAAQAVETTFAPQSFRVTSNGGTAEIPGTESRTVRIEEPRAAKVVVVPAPAEVAANGTMTTTLQVDVQNQWGEAFTGAAMVELAVERDGPGPIAALPTPPIMPQTVACFATVETILTQLVGPDSAEQQQALPAETPMKAVALDVENGRLYIIATVAGEEQSGWVPWPADTAQRTVNCQGDVTTLPDSPPQETPAASPDGFILPQARQAFPEGTGSFDYRAGTVAGIIKVVAHLVDGNGQPVGEPGQAAITLLETGSLGTTSHIFKDPARSLGGDDPANMVLFSMPTGTPLELFPPDSAAPNARQVGLRVWVPASAVTTNDTGETTLVPQIATGTVVSFGSDPQTSSSATTTPPPQSFSDGANGLRVTELEDRGDFRLVRLVGWVPSSALAQQ